MPWALSSLCEVLYLHAWCRVAESVYNLTTGRPPDHQNHDPRGLERAPGLQVGLALCPLCKVHGADSQSKSIFWPLGSPPDLQNHDPRGLERAPGLQEGLALCPLCKVLGVEAEPVYNLAPGEPPDLQNHDSPGLERAPGLQEGLALCPLRKVLGVEAEPVDGEVEEEEGGQAPGGEGLDHVINQVTCKY